MVYSGWDGKELMGTVCFAFSFYFFFLDFIRNPESKAIGRDTVREAREKSGILSSYLLQDMQMLCGW